MGNEGAERALDRVEKHLGIPYYRRQGVALFHGDCLDLLPRLVGSPFALTVTSPPYNIGKEYERARGIDDYLEWCRTWCEQIFRVTRADGSFWLNLGYLSLPDRAKAVPIPYLLWDRIPFFLVQEIVWNYGAGVASSRSFSPRNEKFLWYVKDPKSYAFNLDDVRDPDVKYPNQKKNGKLKCNSLGKNPTDVWVFPKVTSGTDRSSPERTPHPAQFPLAIIDRIVRACSNPCDLILDPFLGSGTLGEVAIRTNRAVVGIEIHEPYLKIAGERLDRAFAQITARQSQGKLFDLE